MYWHLYQVQLDFALVEIWFSPSNVKTGVRLAFRHFNAAKQGKLSLNMSDLTNDLKSKKLCQTVSSECNNIHWSSIADPTTCVKTELSFCLEAETPGIAIFLVALSPRSISYNQDIVNALSGLVYAAYTVGFKNKPINVLDNEEIVSSSTCLYDPLVRLKDEFDRSLILPKPFEESGSVPNKRSEQVGSHNDLVVDSSCIEFSAPTWEPTAKYSYPVADITVKYSVPDNLSFDDFSHVEHLTDGSNSNVFTCRYQGQKAIIKLIKEEEMGNPVAVHEFDLEHGMLARIEHQHIIRVLGAGHDPRRFIVLEYLGGGSLHSKLREKKKAAAEGQSNSSMSGGGMIRRQRTYSGASCNNLLARISPFFDEELLQRAKAIAEALDYLHNKCHDGACIIHRDLKPDNIGFTSDGTVKLFDFGLVTCVKARKHAKDTYNMTGCTGSLRYMAPEVALYHRYTEKVDVYSFGLILWQMATGEEPFEELDKIDFYREVVHRGMRPQLEKTWPADFRALLSRCWHADPEERPSFAMVTIDLDRLILAGSSPPPPVMNSPLAMFRRSSTGRTQPRIINRFPAPLG